MPKVAPTFQCYSVHTTVRSTHAVGYYHFLQTERFKLKAEHDVGAAACMSEKLAIGKKEMKSDGSNKRDATRWSGAWVSCEASRGHYLTTRRRGWSILSKPESRKQKHGNFLITDACPLSRCTKESVDRTMASSLAHTWPYNPNTGASWAMLANIAFV